MIVDAFQETIKRNLQNFNWTVIKPQGLSFNIDCEYLNESLLFTIQIATLLYIGEIEIYLKTLFEECSELKEWNYIINTQSMPSKKNNVKNVFFTHQKFVENLNEIKDEMFKAEKTFREEPIHTILEMVGIETNTPGNNT